MIITTNHWAQVIDRKKYRQPLHAERYYAECRCGWMSEWTNDYGQADDYMVDHVRPHH